jgi:hypothetical protein
VTLRVAAVAVLALALVGCSGAEVLVSKPAAVPAGLDLTGNWVATGNAGTSQPKARDLAVHVFYETGQALKITQTKSGLFLSFDRSVVEEYRFGENREISVGPINVARASGWEGDSYVIETLDEDGAKMIDSYRMQEEGSVLRRKTVILHHNRKQLDLEQFYDRVLP